MHKVRSPESSTAFAPDANRAHSSSALQHSKLSSWCSPPLTQAASSAAITPKGEGAFLEGSRWMWRVAGEQEQAGGAGGAELAEDGSQRVHGARTDPLSLSRAHVS